METADLNDQDKVDDNSGAAVVVVVAGTFTSGPGGGGGGGHSGGLAGRRAGEREATIAKPHFHFRLRYRGHFS